MIGMQAISLPRIVPRDDGGFQCADDACDLAAQRKRAVEFAIDLLKKDHVAALRPGEAKRCLALLKLASGDQSGDVGVGVPGAL